MTEKNNKHTALIEQHIMEGLKPLVRELHMVEPADFIAHIKLDQHGAISDIIATAAEPYFAPDYIGYREVASLELKWNSTPVIALSMVLNLVNAAVEFGLVLGRDTAGVSLKRLDGVEQKDAVELIERGFELNAI